MADICCNCYVYSGAGGDKFRVEFTVDTQTEDPFESYKQNNTTTKKYITARERRKQRKLARRGVDSSNECTKTQDVQTKETLNANKKKNNKVQ